MRTIEVHCVAWCDIDLVLMVAGNSQPDVCRGPHVMVISDIVCVMVDVEMSHVREGRRRSPPS